MGSHRRPPLPRVFVTHYLAVAKGLGPNMQEITWELFLARWAHILIWLEAEADWINLGERRSVWGPGRTFSPQVCWGPLTWLLWTSLRAVAVKAEEKRVYGFLVLPVATQPKVALPHSEKSHGASEFSSGSTGWVPSFHGGPETVISASSFA